MKKVFILIVFLVALGGGWYFLLPLFLDQEVNEDFPVVFSKDQTLMVDGSGEVVDFYPLTQEEIDTMSEEEKIKRERNRVEEVAGQSKEVMQERVPRVNEDDFKPILLSEGQFKNADDFHQGVGRAGIYQLPDGSYLLRFEDFEVTNGPDLRVYLVETENPTKDQVKEGLELAKLKGNKGSQNYELPVGVDPTSYKSVVIYCKPFSVIFSTAGLS